MALPISPSARNRIIAIAVLAACALCVAFPRPWQHKVRGTAHGAARPALGVLAAAHDGLRRAFDRVAALWGAADEIQRLRDENRALREALARLADEAHHTRVRLRNLTTFEQFHRASLARPLRILPANVIGADASPWRHSLVIDRGSADGLRVGTPAVWGNSIVGTIVALRSSTATVRLITDSGAGLTVRVARTDEVGLLQGTSDREGLLQLEWVYLEPIKEGDMVVTSGREPVVPPGLLAGRVVSASKTRKPLFFEVKVRPAIDFNRLSELLVVICAPGEVEELLEEGAEAAK